MSDTNLIVTHIWLAAFAVSNDKTMLLLALLFFVLYSYNCWRAVK